MRRRTLIVFAFGFVTISQGLDHVKFGASRVIQPNPCVHERTREEGVCMFAWDCLNLNGTHITFCRDRFYYGSCCKLPDGVQAPNRGPPTFHSPPSNHIDAPSRTPVLQLTTTGRTPTTSPDAADLPFERDEFTLRPPIVEVQFPRDPTPKPTIPPALPTLYPLVTPTVQRRPIVVNNQHKRPGFPVQGTTPPTTWRPRPTEQQVIAIGINEIPAGKPTWIVADERDQNGRPTTISTVVDVPLVQSPAATIGSLVATRQPSDTDVTHPTSETTTATETATAAATAAAAAAAAAAEVPAAMASITIAATTEPSMKIFTASSTSGSDNKFALLSTEAAIEDVAGKLTESQTPSQDENSIDLATEATTSRIFSTRYPIRFPPKEKPTTISVTQSFTEGPETDAPLPTTHSGATATMLGEVISMSNQTELFTPTASAANTTTAAIAAETTISSTPATITTTAATTTTTTTTTANTVTIAATTTASSTQRTTTGAETTASTAIDDLNSTGSMIPEHSMDSGGNSVTDNPVKQEISSTILQSTVTENQTVPPISRPWPTSAFSSSSTVSSSSTGSSSTGSPVKGTDVNSKGSTVSDVSTDADLAEASTQSIETTTEYDPIKAICGRTKSFPAGRIVGGELTRFGKWPWMISLRQFKKNSFLHKCGAALLNEYWAVSAAHCVHNVSPNDILLRLGEYDLRGLDKEPLGHIERRVQIVATHPKFDSHTFEYDLALMRFYEPISFTDNILPICIAEGNQSYVGQTAVVTGWGRLYEDGPLPSVLQKAQIPIITNQECEKMYRKAGFVEDIPNIFICAGMPSGGKDSCEGDSGGPLVLKDESTGQWNLIGIISWGIGCALPNQPGVYTRITKFTDWIKQIIVF